MRIGLLWEQWPRGTVLTASEKTCEDPGARRRSRVVSMHAEGSRLVLWFHAAYSRVDGGARSWIWAAVSLSITSIGPPHTGQFQKALSADGGAAMAD